jgi:hypothetical protein
MCTVYHVFLHVFNLSDKHCVCSVLIHDDVSTSGYIASDMMINK